MYADLTIIALIALISAGNVDAVKEAEVRINTAYKLCKMGMYTKEQEDTLWKNAEPLTNALFYYYSPEA